MRLRPLPSQIAIALLASAASVVLVCLLLGRFVFAAWLAAALFVGLLLAALVDYWLTRRAWDAAAAQLTRHMPAAFAIGVERAVKLALVLEGMLRWRIKLHDYTDPTLTTRGLPRTIELRGGQITEFEYHVMPTRRGEIVFAPADISIRSRFGLLDLLSKLGPTERRRV
jgi:uncharacterized protein (DUF58 family)